MFQFQVCFRFSSPEILFFFCVCVCVCVCACVFLLSVLSYTLRKDITILKGDFKTKVYFVSGTLLKTLHLLLGQKFVRESWGE